MTRKAEVTVRLPTARIAPTSRSLACSKTRWEKQGAKLIIKGTSSTGRVSINDLSWRKSPQLTLPVVSFSKSKMDKVELRVHPELPVSGYLQDLLKHQSFPISQPHPLVDSFLQARL